MEETETRESEVNGEEGRMSFLDHLGELRVRLVRAAIAIAIGFGVCIYFGERLFSLLAAPIMKLLPKDASLVFTALTDPFFVYLKVAFIAGLFLALPFVLYQIWLFVRPGLHTHERKLAAPFIMVATLLFYLGGMFAYFLVFPAAFKFFLSYTTPELKPMLAIKEFVSLVMLLMLAFGAIFETPIIILFLGLLGIFSSDTLKKGRRYFIVIAFVIAAVLTPTPDVLNQTLMAVPLMLFYEVGIHLLAIFERKRKRREEEEEEEDTPSASAD
ncbi:MAG: twin-arginine translocase subunit TatC [Desulfomonile tiedjei]|nr:twin-arginine translocase subunit TatC [Desulfomonile tiedjei]